MDQLFPLVGPWFWWIVAGVLLLTEMLMPGFFMLWLAFAAALTAIVDQVFHLSWVGEVITFAALSILSVAGSWRFVMASRNAKSESPHLNQRSNAFIGRTYILEKPIINGSGKIKVEDTIWDVDGEDAAAGTRVKVTAVEGMRLRVEKG
jgi:membrane protein implicated in regulation of membrane protease activity